VPDAEGQHRGAQSSAGFNIAAPHLRVGGHGLTIWRLGLGDQIFRRRSAVGARSSASRGGPVRQEAPPHPRPDAPTASAKDFPCVSYKKCGRDRCFFSVPLLPNPGHVIVRSVCLNKYHPVKGHVDWGSLSCKPRDFPDVTRCRF
jgi:hypothetical protein